MKKKALLIQQLEQKMSALKTLPKSLLPPQGWIKTLRLAVGMSSQQLGDKLHITRQGVKEMEDREQSGSITLRSLRQAAQALDMELIYGFIPKDGSLDALIERKAYALASEMAARVSQSMLLEDQEVPYQSLKKSIKDRTESFKKDLPKQLWD